ncbi:DUF1501 domain-containing protein [Engelhardtia mirabilis]|uniref:Sulfatase n=1 Tax=Engelhardtia mirabilis TaxID=2528011 RepID=A0A518BLR3_9BACT|nr:hypothetical protein Pla133_29910 [Planctomycetes bacterium Pla133]QDV02228.1 hypothetical protein Pla86_29900 [Planctomycetes bacterium Pla86]
MSADRSANLARRDLLRLGAFAGLGLGASPLMPSALAHAALGAASSARRADACILIWLDGGPSHLDTFDPKPEAPAEYRGEFGAIDTSLDGVRICEHLPRTAKMMDQVALIRTLTSAEGNHDRGSHHYMTGFRPSPALVYPSMGSVLARQRGVGDAGVPTYVTLGRTPQYGGAGYLDRKYDPYETAVGAARDVSTEGLSIERMERRRALRERVQAAQGGSGDSTLDSFYGQAFDLLTSPVARNAFDLSLEPEASRSRFGGTGLSDACLTARRLVEAGSRFVTVYNGGWDMHDDVFQRLTFGYPGPLPTLDLAYPALIADLAERGMLERTLVVLMGEFGRTPKINAKGGRDHWPRSSFCVMAGGGIRTGQALGRTDARGELPAERPVTPEELIATIYDRLGVQTSATYQTADGRRLQVLPDHVRPIGELL